MGNLYGAISGRTSQGGHVNSQLPAIVGDYLDTFADMDDIQNQVSRVLQKHT